VIVTSVAFTICGEAGADKFFQAKPLKVLSKKLGEVTPFWVITGQQYCLVAKRIGIVFYIC